MQTLGTGLPGFLNGRTEVRVVLSNHFVRYGIFYNSENITRSDEELALVQHQFSRIYGQSSANWEFSLSPVERFDLPRVACAVDHSLLGAIRDILSQHHLPLKSVQPYLTMAYSQHYSRLSPHSWLALVEDGILCLALLQNGRWHSIKTLRIDSDWQRGLTCHIQRETLLAGLSEANSGLPCPVVVIAPEYPEPVDISRNCSPEQNSETGEDIVLDPSQWPKPVQVSGTVHAMAVYA